MARIVIIQGHPDRHEGRFCRALAQAYAEGARGARHDVQHIDVAEIEFPLLRSKKNWDEGDAPRGIAKVQPTVIWAEHLVIIYPLWLGAMPALLKGFLEQLFRPGYGMARTAGSFGWKQLMAGRSSRIVITMGMPAFAYRWYFGAHSLKGLKRNILAFVGIGPNRHTLIGNVEGVSNRKRQLWLQEMRNLGEQAR